MAANHNHANAEAASRTWAAMPDFARSVQLSTLAAGYRAIAIDRMPRVTFPAAAILVALACAWAEPVARYVAQLLAAPVALEITLARLLAVVLGVAVLWRCGALNKAAPVYLLDLAVYAPPKESLVTRQRFKNFSKEVGKFDEKSLEFQTRLIDRAGLGDATSLPPGILAMPPDISMARAREEAEEVIFQCVDSVLAKTRLKPRDFTVLVVNCSLFCPTPSLASMVVNKYGFKSNVQSYSLGGMGCSAGVIAVALAKDLLASHGGLALVVSTENITQNWYFGNDRSMLIPNTLFRVGASAVVMSSRSGDRARAKYVLNAVVRTHRGADDASYGCVYQREDDKGTTGVSLSRDLITHAGVALKNNITALAPRVLPLSEQARFLMREAKLALTRRRQKATTKAAAAAAAAADASATKVPAPAPATAAANSSDGDGTASTATCTDDPNKPYVPNFGLAFDHFCIHTGGRGVIDAMQKQLRLSDSMVEPSRATLRQFGNTSSSSVWYELAYSEHEGLVRRGHRVWQIAFGSGFKCNSAVWTALRNVPAGKHKAWDV
ncbi:hypothetical protein PPROV_000476400 [Pycnococcus provasolii]|uniref:3-ketoacyl-CoA synthase n=1 Tax=Pycnococcus provasolii TaxID=41880 RepID=A0A830HLV3_9CHLO|nr:hypothetical protein PPROV_000476400 [Pycnococcus provasolii]